MTIHSRSPLIRCLSSTLNNTLLSLHRPRRIFQFVKGVFRYPLQHEATKAHESIPAITFAAMFPEFTASQIVLQREQVDRHGWNVKLHEEILLGEVVRAMNAKRIFEIGTFDGGTTRRLAESASEEAVVYTLDLPEDQFDATQGPTAFNGSRVGEKYRNSHAVNKIKQIRANASKFDFGPFAAQMDFVFVDAAHDYSNGLADSTNALKMVKPGGIIVWHDFGPYWSGLVHAICGATTGLPLRRLAGTSMAVLRR